MASVPSTTSLQMTMAEHRVPPNPVVCRVRRRIIIRRVGDCQHRRSHHPFNTCTLPSYCTLMCYCRSASLISNIYKPLVAQVQVGILLLQPSLQVLALNGFCLGLSTTRKYRAPCQQLFFFELKPGFSGTSYDYELHQRMLSNHKAA